MLSFVAQFKQIFGTNCLTHNLTSCISQHNINNIVHTNVPATPWSQPIVQFHSILILNNTLVQCIVDKPNWYPYRKG